MQRLSLEENRRLAAELLQSLKARQDAAKHTKKRQPLTQRQRSEAQKTWMSGFAVGKRLEQESGL